MNEPKASRYHRLKRLAGLASLLITAALLLAMLWVRPQLHAATYGALLAGLHELLTLPVALYRYALDRRYDVSIQPLSSWLKDLAKGLGISVVLATAVAGVVYELMVVSPALWWLIAALLGAGAAVLIAGLAPVLLLPLFFRLTPVDRPGLTARLMDLADRAGVSVLGVYAIGFGDRTKRANAALVGMGPTRRIVVSDTLLAGYTDDEIEVILAHELAHHAHRDIAKGILLECLLFLAAGFGASLVLNGAWEMVRLRGPADPAGLPLLAFVGGAVILASTPLVNALSRSRERSADAFALALTRRPDAFVAAMRRLGAQNLAEENPSRASVWLFHTHPPIEERIATAMHDA